MKLAITKERDPRETRVAASPESVKKLVAMGLDVTIETGAGDAAWFSDQSFIDAGASIGADLASTVVDAGIVFKVRRPGADELALYQRGAMLAAMLEPYGDLAGVQALADAGVDAFAMEFMPRISRAQSMDVLSSQANLAGYKAVIDAVAEFSRAIPMMMTAAGTIAPARVFILGAGVAGLQAIATARRLGAIVSATDVRPVVKEQVESLGASFVMVEAEEGEQAETAGGYAKEMSEDYQRRQAELVARHVSKQDIVITTALIPGRPAPVLISEQMVESMKPGSIIVDLAVEQGGNCPLSRVGEIVDHQGVRIMGHANMPGRLPVDASAMYARNLLNFVAPFIDSQTGALTINWDDELIAGTALTRDGQIIHPAFVQAGNDGAP